jgi:predicted RNA methylase
VPSSDEKVRIMMEFTGDIKGKKVADLGCGNGKLLLN